MQIFFTLLDSKGSSFQHFSKCQICESVSLFFRDADKVLSGDDVLVYANNELSSEKVTNVTSFEMHGKIFTIAMKTLVFSVKNH